MDGKRFEKCTFIECTLIYRGGSPGEASDCVFYPDTVWAFEGMAATIVQTLQRYGFQFRFGREGGEEPIRFPSGAM